MPNELLGDQLPAVHTELAWYKMLDIDLANGRVRWHLIAGGSIKGQQQSSTFI